MSAAVYHWKRHWNTTATASGSTQRLATKRSSINATHCKYNNIIPRSIHVATIRHLGMKDPKSPWHLLAGLEESMGILSRILSYTDEWGILPCTCCKTRPVVFCCHRRKRLLREYRHPNEAAAALTAKEDGENEKNEDEMDDHEHAEEIPERFFVHAKPHHVRIEKCHLERRGDSTFVFQEKLPLDYMHHHIHQNHQVTTIYRPLPPMFPGGAKCWLGNYIVLDDSGFHHSGSHILWEDSHQYTVTLSPKSGLRLTRENISATTEKCFFGYYPANDNEDDDENLHRGRQPDGAITIRTSNPTPLPNFTVLGTFPIKFFIAGRHSIAFGKLDGAELIYARFQEFQRQFRSKSWLGRIAKENPRHLRELYHKTEQNCSRQQHTEEEAMAM